MNPEQSRKMREEMITSQLISRGIRCESVLETIRQIPREEFVPNEIKHRAYEDKALSIGQGQTISQPYIVALMTETLALEEHHKVLEVGSGSGYQTALLARLSRWVYTVERIPELRKQAIERLEKLGINNVTFLQGDGTLGFERESPFDRIIVTAAAIEPPESLKRQMVPGGRMVMPVGPKEVQQLMLYRREGVRVIPRKICRCVFVPLIGEEGWQET